MLLGQTTQPVSLLEVFVPLMPWVLVFVCIWFVVYRSLKSANAHQTRAQAHWAAVEAKLGRLIELVERQSGGK